MEGGGEEVNFKEGILYFDNRIILVQITDQNNKKLHLFRTSKI